MHLRELASTGSPRPRHKLPDVPAHLVGVFITAALGSGLICYSYWPGIMIDDARWQYQQAVDNAFEDWHPPMMAWIWRQLIALSPGPAPMLVLQALLYWTGLALVAAATYKRGHPRLALGLTCMGFLPAPLALLGTVTKDALMAGALLVASGLALWASEASTVPARRTLAFAAIIALFLAAGLRLNAVFACVPLALAVLPRPLVATRPRAIFSAVLAAFAFLMTPPALASLLHAEDTDVQLSLITFDLGGITERTGISQFPDLKVKNPVAANHDCYDPSEWDSYSNWAPRACPVGFDAIQQLVDDEDLKPRTLWLHAVTHHPIAYIQHRWAHFNLSTWFIVASGPDFTAWSQSVPNPWNFQVRQSRVLSAITGFADRAALTPLGWPIFWISVALATTVAGFAGRAAATPVAIAASAFCYGAGYFIVGVATGIRYYIWSFSGAALAAALIIADLHQRRFRLPRLTLALCAAIVIAPTLVAIAARIIL